ncbi:hypothetical protein GCM10027299_41520 [Larkinella ripae]
MNVFANPYYKCLFLLAGLLASSFAAKAQSGYTLVGSAQPASVADYVSLTQERPGQPQTGALWYNQLLRLADSFEVEFTVNFSANNFAADGITVVMQTAGTKALGGAGSGIGYRDQSLRPSFGIEFDTHYNGETDDPRGDHMALVRDGNNGHQFNTSFPKPVPISTTSNSIKDGLDHVVKLSWNAVTHFIQVEVDCVPRISQSIDLINDVFGGTQEVYFGFTSSTGTAGNAHTLYAPKDLIAYKTLRACPKETLTLVAGLSIDGKYDWKPDTGLNDTHIRNPQLLTSTNQVYTVSYVNRCSLLKNDTVAVKINGPDLTITGNREVCENEVIELSPVLNPTNTKAKFRWSTGDTTRQYKPKASGLYKLQVTIDNCTVSDSSLVTFHPVPKLDLSIDSTLNCQMGSPISLDPKASGQNLKYFWTSSGTNEPTFLASLPGRYTVQISTEFGCSVQKNFTILDNCLPATLIFTPDVFTPNGDGINEVFEWKSNVEIEAQMKIYNRWGEVIFSSSNPNDFWDGTSSGQHCPSSTYFWKLDYQSSQSKTNGRLVKQGEVILIR